MHGVSHLCLTVLVIARQFKAMHWGLILLITASFLTTAAGEESRPNIIWIYAEDTSPWMGCYGDRVNTYHTPNIDSLASAGVRFSRAFVPAPVCSATRSAMMLGQNAIRFGGHEHRSSRKGPKIHLPKDYQLLPELMQEVGYTTFNHGKTDYNYVWNAEAYCYPAKSKTDFTDLVNRQPFFGQIQTKGGKNNTSQFPMDRKVNPNEVIVPEDYPDNAIYRQVVAQHYDAIRMDDDLIGDILKGLREAGLTENTIVVYFSDHGANNLLRHKQMTTEGGLHVPFIIMGPENYVPSNEVRHDLVDLLDLSATTLAWAGIEAPAWYEGQDLFAADFKARAFVGAQKDRLDHTVDRVRSIRTDRFRYVRNYKLDRVFLQPQYRDRKEFTQNLHQLYQEGNLSERHREIYFGERPAEELYDVSRDPHMMHNLAGNPDFALELSRHRSLLDDWLAEGDHGVREEPVEALQANGEGTPWGEGVNVEYEAYRVDSDGDGLSDKWEILNGRDPQDGRLYYTFDCGGWQNEGWFSKDIKSNLAGFLGYLDFYLDYEEGSLQRTGLKIQAQRSDDSIMIRLRADEDLTVRFYANAQFLGFAAVKGTNQFEAASIPLNPSIWQDIIETLEVRFESKKGTLIEIDTIQVERL